MATDGDEARVKNGMLFIPMGRTVVGSEEFSGRRDFGHVILPDSVEWIQREAFQDCVELLEVVFPASLAKIGSRAFAGCVSLQNLAFEEGLRRIGNGAFSGCESLGEVVLPKSVKQVDCSAFSGCATLERLVVPGLTLFGGEGEDESNWTCVFEGCVELKDVWLSPDAWDLNCGGARPVEVRPLGALSSPNMYGRYLDSKVDRVRRGRRPYDDNGAAPVSVRAEVTADHFPDDGKVRYGGFRHSVGLEVAPDQGRGRTHIAGFEIEIPLCEGGFDLLMTKYLYGGEQIPVDLEIRGAGLYRISDSPAPDMTQTPPKQYAVAYRPPATVPANNHQNRDQYGICCFRVRAVYDGSSETSLGPWSPYYTSEIGPGLKYGFYSGGYADGCEEWYGRLNAYFDEAVRAFCRVGQPVGPFALISRRKALEEEPLQGMTEAEIFDQLMTSPDDKIVRAARRILLRLPEDNPWRVKTLETYRGYKDDRLY